MPQSSVALLGYAYTDLVAVAMAEVKIALTECEVEHKKCPIHEG